MSQSNLETQKSSDPCHTERQMGRQACIDFNRGRGHSTYQRFSGQIFRKQKLVQSKGRHSTLCQPARDTRGRRASRLEVHTSYHTHLHDLWTPQRGCPSERAITPHRIVPPSTSKSRSAGLLHTRKRSNPAARVQRKRKKKVAVPRVCSVFAHCPAPFRMPVIRQGVRCSVLWKVANSFRCVGTHTGPCSGGASNRSIRTSAQSITPRSIGAVMSVKKARH